MQKQDEVPIFSFCRPFPWCDSDWSPAGCWPTVVKRLCHSTAPAQLAVLRPSPSGWLQADAPHYCPVRSHCRKAHGGTNLCGCVRATPLRRLRRALGIIPTANKAGNSMLLYSLLFYTPPLYTV